jgi:hypothetical protein
MNRQANPPYAGPRQSRPRPTESRPVTAAGQSENMNSMSAESIRARAERFEDEKRRLIESLFAKKDEDGSQVESYITHIRIIEDAAYPSSPPPATSSQDNKKDRAIIIAVRKSGKVRVHKARENATGTFSIGKTWDLDSLGPIQSFHDLVPDVGFSVSLGKPYCEWK